MTAELLVCTVGPAALLAPPLVPGVLAGVPAGLLVWAVEAGAAALLAPTRPSETWP